MNTHRSRLTALVLTLGFFGNSALAQHFARSYEVPMDFESGVGHRHDRRFVGFDR